MDKKQYLLKLISLLEDKWSMAKGLKILIEYKIVDDQTLDALQHVFADAIKKVNDTSTYNSLMKAQIFLKRLQEKELQDKASDEELDQLLENI
jgi:hypothetical protein